MPDADTRTALLDVAQEFAQTRGYNAFSFRDLADRVGVKTASIHYWFPTKGDLGRELMVRYRESFTGILDAISERTTDARRRLQAFVDLFRSTLRAGDRMCLCGMLAVEYSTLPAAVQDEVKAFFVLSEKWLARVLDEGKRARTLKFEGTPDAAARVLFASLEGAMMSARAFGDEGRLESAGKWLVEAVTR
ncbi:MAG: TetR/AcrR family transcriptional regulator [Planctomycetes bacterium]|nr:TetR/AcrR family transcriptional regulator [Planctomycetota bacterium]